MSRSDIVWINGLQLLANVSVDGSLTITEIGSLQPLQRFHHFAEGSVYALTWDKFTGCLAVVLQRSTAEEVGSGGLKVYSLSLMVLSPKEFVIPKKYSTFALSGWEPSDILALPKMTSHRPYAANKVSMTWAHTGELLLAFAMDEGYLLVAQHQRDVDVPGQETYRRSMTLLWQSTFLKDIEIVPSEMCVCSLENESCISSISHPKRIDHKQGIQFPAAISNDGFIIVAASLLATEKVFVWWRTTTHINVGMTWTIVTVLCHSHVIHSLSWRPSPRGAVNMLLVVSGNQRYDDEANQCITNMINVHCEGDVWIAPRSPPQAFAILRADTFMQPSTDTSKSSFTHHANLQPAYHVATSSKNVYSHATIFIEWVNWFPKIQSIYSMKENIENYDAKVYDCSSERPSLRGSWVAAINKKRTSASRDAGSEAVLWHIPSVDTNRVDSNFRESKNSVSGDVGNAYTSQLNVSLNCNPRIRRSFLRALLMNNGQCQKDIKGGHLEAKVFGSFDVFSGEPQRLSIFYFIENSLALFDILLPSSLKQSSALQENNMPNHNFRCCNVQQNSEKKHLKDSAQQIMTTDSASDRHVRSRWRLLSEHATGRHLKETCFFHPTLALWGVINPISSSRSIPLIQIFYNKIPSRPSLLSKSWCNHTERSHESSSSLSIEIMPVTVPLAFGPETAQNSIPFLFWAHELNECILTYGKKDVDTQSSLLISLYVVSTETNKDSGYLNISVRKLNNDHNYVVAGTSFADEIVQLVRDGCNSADVSRCCLFYLILPKHIRLQKNQHL